MKAQTFITKLKDFSSRYKEWWFKPFIKFREDYSNGLEHYSKALKEFELQLRNQNDLIGEIYNFLEQNYDVYLSANPHEREEIRKTVSDSYYVDNRGSVNHFLEDLFLRYGRERAIPKIKETGDKTWLTRGLIAISLENSGIDYRDSILLLHELYKVADERNLDPKTEFMKIAQISSIETPRGGSTPMSKMMANIS
jgi:hypothetical protein